MRKWMIALAIVIGVAGFFLYFRWSSSIKQPLKFAHYQHVEQKISCDTCHKPQTLNYLTPSTICKECHAGMNVPDRVQWVRVYRVSPDIIFDHARHNQVCSTCHQEMTSAQRFVREYRYPMNFCMDCHRKEGARNECKTCHKYM